ncbi:hypothetical protein JAAARDRAFT_204104 [Jaapia argillacea MUCL 33604]|uniref:Uncharacterized protein n=1 Tax=Jaapia argillacea MUCL 33604 TaxID=933084 RepID=A0A067Q622_9AGAM|nr:hypothetical protein JAAARDRAFT_204104 [Jaapia argillacea MUCL 33604]
MFAEPATNGKPQPRSATDYLSLSDVFHDSDDQVEFLDPKPHSEAGHGPLTSPPPTSRDSNDFDRDSDSGLDARSERDGAAHSSTPPLGESRRKETNERKILGKMVLAVMVVEVLRRSPAATRQSVSLERTKTKSREQTKREGFAKAWRLRSSLIIAKDETEERNELERRSNEQDTPMHQRQRQRNRDSRNESKDS